ncbi:AraC family transcriptional regulator [uncultured Methylobacterium sp.]|uniref:helix-turn-helix transcriptional regulator n=1 Tax=uncultured Methylobacterium sp. TaxID=157278 RepID=UPI0035CB1BDF
MDFIPSIHLEVRNIQSGTGLQVLQRTLPHYNLSPAFGTTDTAFAGRFSAWFLGDLILLKSSLPAFKLARTSVRIQDDGIDAYSLIVLPRGSRIGRAEHRDETIGSRQLACLDLSRPFEAEVSACDAIQLFIGRTTLQSAVRTDFDVAATVLEGTTADLLTDYLLALSRHVDAVRIDEADPLCKATIAQIAAAIDLIPSPERIIGRTPGIRIVVQRFIDRNLTDVDLSPDQISNHLGVPRSTLYRSFEAYGGIAAYIQRRRLQAVRALLLHPDEERSIGELAETFGFSRASHFTTAFRRAFGCTPRHLRSNKGRLFRARSTRDPAEAPAVFRGWIEEIRLR